jgi:hypothetical protein
MTLPKRPLQPLPRLRQQQTIINNTELPLLVHSRVPEVPEVVRRNSQKVQHIIVLSFILCVSRIRLTTDSTINLVQMILQI